MHDALISVQVPAWMLPAATGGVLEPHRRRLSTSPGALIAHVRPQIPGPGSSSPGVEHRQGSVIGMEMSAAQHVAANRQHQGAQQPIARPYPLRKKRAFELEAGEAVYLALTIQRLVQAVFARHYVRHQRRSRQSPFDGARGSPRLHDL